MKMRKKLAALLAAAMIASVMPMTAFAATKNHVVSSVRVERGKTTQVNPPMLTIHDDNLDVQTLNRDRDFYLELDGASFLSAGAILYTLDNGNHGKAGEYNNDLKQVDARLNSRGYYEVDSAKRPVGTFAAVGDYDGLEFRFDGNRLAINTRSMLGTTAFASSRFVLPILATITGDVATIAIDGNDTGISDMIKTNLALTGTSKSTVIIGDVPAIYYGLDKDLATITLQENFDGAFDRVVGDTLVMEIELDSSDYKFHTNDAKNPLIIKAYGGLGQYTAKDGRHVTATSSYKYEGRRDERTLVIEIPKNQINSGGQAGKLEIALKVDATTKDPEVGPLKADITSDFFASQSVTLANVAKFGVEIVPKEDYKFVTGQKVKVEFNLNELVDDSLVDKRATELSLPDGVKFVEGSIRIDGEKPVTGNEIFYGGDQLKNDDPQKVTVYLGTDRDKLDKFKFEADLLITSAFKGDIDLTVTGRAVEEAVTAKLAETTPPVTVEVEPIQVKAGLKVQKGGKITITETDKGRFMSGNDIVIALVDKDSGMSLTGAKVAVTGDLKAGDVEVKAEGGELRINVKRRSKVASTIELTDIELKIDRSVPIGNYEVEVGGTAISKLAVKAHTKTENKTEIVTETAVNNNGEVIYEDKTTGAYLGAGATGKAMPNAVARKVEKEIKWKVGDKVEADLDAIKKADFILLGDPVLGLKSTVVFNIGSEKYTVDGIEQTMDAKAYIKDGRTMVPVRYLASALGVEEAAIKFNSGIVTIFVGNGNVVQLKVGSKDLVTNGMTIPMVAAAEIIDGRTYVPVTEIGSVFGVTGVWDSAAQTATFSDLSNK